MNMHTKPYFLRCFPFLCTRKCLFVFMMIVSCTQNRNFVPMVRRAVWN